MHLPSERVHREMQSEETKLWFIPANGRDEIALLIKAPSSTIKALIAGWPLRLLFGRKGPYFSAGVRVLDMPDAPVMISGSQRQAEEHQALLRAVIARRMPVFSLMRWTFALHGTTLN
jgi:hypothetical protein